ncbi:hypothetical protein ZPAH1_orf00243 [Aeromonas phage ZPAH1]|nr:hypothetical protein ZPAH1_orf00243 [Aeromonas phage ZPAH1]
MKNKKKVITTDIDGCVVQWQSNLVFFAAEHNLPTDTIIDMILDEKFRPMHEIFDCSPAFGDQLLQKYNESKWIRGLKPYDDALKIINELKEEFDFVGITALGTKFEVAANRMSNLNVLFPGAFREVLICNHNESKEQLFNQAYEHYGDRICMYIDDLDKHCSVAERVFNQERNLNIPIIRMDRRMVDVYPKGQNMYAIDHFSGIKEFLK